MNLDDMIKHLQEIRAKHGNLPGFVNGVQGVGEMQQATKNCFSVVSYSHWFDTCQPAYKELKNSNYNGPVLDIGGWN